MTCRDHIDNVVSKKKCGGLLCTSQDRIWIMLRQILWKSVTGKQRNGEMFWKTVTNDQCFFGNNKTASWSKGFLKVFFEPYGWQDPLISQHQQIMLGPILIHSYCTQVFFVICMRRWRFSCFYPPSTWLPPTSYNHHWHHPLLRPQRNASRALQSHWPHCIVHSSPTWLAVTPYVITVTATREAINGPAR